MISKNPITNVIGKGYEYLAKAGNITQVLILLFFRVNWGWLFFVTGKGKLINHANVASFFTSINLPAPDLTAWFVGGVECIGGLLLLIGLATRPVGLTLSINMLVAYLSVEEDRQKLLNFFADQDAFFQADPFFFLLAALLAFSFGGGRFSLDYFLEKRLKRKNES